MKWRARGVVLALYATLLVGFALWLAVPSLGSLRIPPSVGYPVVIVLLVAWYGAGFAFFRCPHCRAAQIRGISGWDWLLIDDRCRKCGQLLDGPAVPRNVLTENLLAQHNPSLVAEMRRDRLAMEDLAQRAATDATAARELEQKFALEVERLTEWVEVVHEHAPEREAEARRDLEQAQGELAKWRSLRAGTDQGGRLTSAGRGRGERIQ